MQQNNLPLNSVWLLGNFDGVHRGHQALIHYAQRDGLPVGVLSFNPHPRAFFHPETPPFLLTPWPQREKLLHHYGVAACTVLPFDAALSQLSAHDFIETILKPLAPNRLYIGEDFHFGHQRNGDKTTLQAALGTEAIQICPLISDASGQCYSSTRIRTAISAGDMGEATTLLGRPYTIEAIVQRGDQRGRLLGFPTANLALNDYLRPRYGVYAATVEGIGHAVANLGIRPTLDGTKEWLEVHIPQFNGDLYGKTLSIQLHRFIRPERRFASLDALKQQIAQDVKTALICP